MPAATAVRSPPVLLSTPPQKLTPAGSMARPRKPWYRAARYVWLVLTAGTSRASSCSSSGRSRGAADGGADRNQRRKRVRQERRPIFEPSSGGKGWRRRGKSTGNFRVTRRRSGEGPSLARGPIGRGRAGCVNR